MNLREYKKVSKFSYLKYCNYLKNKYGRSKGNFFNVYWSQNQKIKRTDEGIVIHHIMENKAIMLARKDYAMQLPYKWQHANKLVYCDLLEHLFLHILICENSLNDKNKNTLFGLGGIINFLVPELNDVYSGWITKQSWRLNTHRNICNDLDVYLMLIKRFKNNFPKYGNYLYKSFSEIYSIDNWVKEKDKRLFTKIKNL